MAVLQDLELVEQGEHDRVRASEAYLQNTETKPQLPSELPCFVFESGPPETKEPLIELNNIHASYGALQILKDFSWKMMPDDHVLIEGPNGCGKSTLLSFIDGDNHKAYGQDVVLFGKRKGTGETIWELKSKSEWSPTNYIINISRDGESLTWWYQVFLIQLDFMMKAALPKKK